MQPRFERVERARHYENLKYNKYDSEMQIQQQLDNDKKTTNHNKKTVSNHHHQKKTRKVNKTKGRVNFENRVDVIPIPMRSEYSNRVASKLYHNAAELYEMALRNQEEFLAEGWNWRNVLEEEEMYVCTATGNKIHPVHIQLMNEWNANEPSLFI